MRKINQKINEGMRAGDLNDLILPLISVDEYDSTVDANAVSIGFYVHDESAANDLTRFLQKSPVAILSSEVSPAPDQHGYFIVFIELMPSKQLAKNVEFVLKEIEPLCEIGEWKMRVRKHDGLIPFTIENFEKAFEAARRTDESKNILNFLTPSILDNAWIEDRNLILETSSDIVKFRILDFDKLDKIIPKHKLTEQSIGLSLNQISRTNRLENMLGDGWSVSEVGPYTLLQHFSTEACLLLR